jgi:hypothetical protein
MYTVDRKLKKGKKKRKGDDVSRDVNIHDEAEEEDFQLVKLPGTGRILTSGTTVMGKMGARFSQELSVGDAIIILHPTSLQEETRIVKMVLSDVSISIRFHCHGHSF